MGNTDTKAAPMLSPEDCKAIEAAADKSSATTRKTLQFRTPTTKIGAYRVTVTVERDPVNDEERAFVTAERTRIDGNNARKLSEAADAKKRDQLATVDLTLAAAIKANALMASLKG